MKKAIWILIAIAVSGYLVNNYFENKASKETKRALVLEKKNAMKIAVAKMVKRNNAVDTWSEKLLKGKRFRMENIMSIELEKLWIGERPILFGGSIDDVSTISKNKYRVVLSRSLFSSLNRGMFDTELLLDLECDRSIIDSMLKSHSDIFKNFGFNNGVVVVAKINGVKSDYKMDTEGGKKEIRIGKGSCVDIMYTGEN